MIFRQIWQRVTDFLHAGIAGANRVTRRDWRMLEAEVLRERAEAVRLRDELRRQGREAEHQRAEIGRQAAEHRRDAAEIHRLRAENRALLNSILGIAGVPPVNVPPPLPDDLDTPLPGDIDAPLPGDIDTPLQGDIDAALLEDADERSLRDADASTSPGSGALAISAAAFDQAHATEGVPMNSHFAPLPEKGPSPLAKPESPAPRSPLFNTARPEHATSILRPGEYPAHAAAENAAQVFRPGELNGTHAAPAEEGLGSSRQRRRDEKNANDPSNAQANRDSSALPRQRFPRASSLSPRNPRPATPLRRRSWHQINRRLEIESAKKPVASG